MNLGCWRCIKAHRTITYLNGLVLKKDPEKNKRRSNKYPKKIQQRYKMYSKKDLEKRSQKDPDSKRSNKVYGRSINESIFAFKRK